MSKMGCLMMVCAAYLYLQDIYEEANEFEGKFMSALAALTMAYCRACSSDSNNDDILMIVIQQLNQGKSCISTRLLKHIANFKSYRFSQEIHR